jgi:CBS domain containing-hemolysin-like protein
MSIFIVSVMMALSISAFCSLMEAALLSLTPAQVAELTDKHPGTGAIWQGFKRNIERPIAVILIMNTAAHTIGASIAGAQFDELFGDDWIWVFSLAFTFLMLQYTEILPKTLGVRYNRKMALLIATPLSVAIRVFSPVIRVIYWLNRPFENGNAHPERANTVDEIASLAAMARLSKEIGRHQERIIRTAPHLSSIPASKVMIPLAQVSMFSTAQTVHEALIAAHIDAHTRFLICEGDDRRNVIGYVNFKELVYFMHTNSNCPRLEGIVHPVHFVTPDKPCSELLKTFVEQHVHMAVVRDRDNHALGLITLEDIVEELVGELEDEFDRLPRHIHRLAGNTWMIGGGAALEEIETALGRKLSERKGTLASWLESQATAPIRIGDKIVIADCEFVIRRIRRGRPFDVSVSIIANAGGGDSQIAE